MAAAGMPLLCSDKVGAASQFLEEGKNGFYFKSADKKSLAKLLQKVMNISDKELIRMADESHALGVQLNPGEWSRTLLSVLSK
jgi:glycosyltransferase involved in cell wall biosynthesis